MRLERHAVGCAISEATRLRPARRWALVLAACLLAAGAGAVVALSPASRASSHANARVRRHLHSARAARVPRALSVVTGPLTAGWRPVASVGGRPAAWLARRGGVTLLRVDQQLAHLSLHAGSHDGGTLGWVYGDRVGASEIHRLIAAINGGFKLTYANVGFMSGGHVAVALKRGLASVVTYSDGTTDIGAWLGGVPSPNRRVRSVLQNQRLLVDRGVAAADASTCVLGCWGGTVGLQKVVARSSLGITANGQLVWAGGERLSPGGLAHALIAAGAVRAIELDINPWWVAGYLYLHRSGGPRPVPLVAGQRGVAGAFFKPYSRDFFTFVAN